MGLNTQKLNSQLMNSLKKKKKQKNTNMVLKVKDG